MKSQLAQDLEGAPLSARDDAFLVTHYLAGTHELRELDAAIAELQARRSECASVRINVGAHLRERHPAGKHFAAHGSLLTLPPAKQRAAEIAVAPIELLA